MHLTEVLTRTVYLNLSCPDYFSCRIGRFMNAPEVTEPAPAE